MGKFIFAVIVTAASLALVESIFCNQCAFNVLGQCIGRGNITCNSNTSVCYTDRYVFTLFSSSMSINSTSCRQANATCGISSTNNVLNALNMTAFPYTVSTECCSTDNCNQIVMNAAPSTKMTLAVVGAVLASVWGGLL